MIFFINIKKNFSFMNSLSVFVEHKIILSLMCNISAIGLVAKISCQNGKIQETRK